MPEAELHGGRVRLQSEYRERELVKGVPGARWDRDDRVWTYPLSWSTCVSLRATFGDGLTVGDALNRWAAAERERRIDPALRLREAADAEDLRFLSALFPHQRAGVAFLRAAGHALVGDDMGTGKTRQAIALLEVAGAYPALVVCPSTVKRVWEREILEASPGAVPHVLEGGAAGRRKQIAAFAAEERNAILIVNWEQLALHSRLAAYGYVRLSEKEREEKELNAIPFAAVIADEAHRAKNPKAKQTRALWRVGWAPSVRHRVPMTGTPVANSPEDLWSLMHFACPEEYPSKTSFVDRFCVQSWNNFGFKDVTGIRGDRMEEFQRIFKPRFLRRTKQEVLPDLPPKTHQERTVRMGTKQRRAYEQLRDEAIAELDGQDGVRSGFLVPSNPLEKLGRLVQLAAAYGELGPERWELCERRAVDGEIAIVPIEEYAVREEAAEAAAQHGQAIVRPGKRALALAEPSCKVDGLLEIAEELGGQQCVVFAESRQLVELAAAALDREGYGAVQLTGAVSEAIRALNVEEFQRGDAQFLLATLGAGGEGITLTAASVALFLQRSFSLVKNAQAEDRLHRFGQHSPVEVVTLVTEGTVEEAVLRVAREKRERLEEVVQDRMRLRRLYAGKG